MITSMSLIYVLSQGNVRGRDHAVTRGKTAIRYRGHAIPDVAAAYQGLTD